MRRFVGTGTKRLRCLPIAGLALVLSGILAALAGLGGPSQAQTPAPAATPVQPWGLPPLPPGVGPVEKFADVSDTPQGKFLEGGAFDSQGNLWFVAIGSGWVSYLTPDGQLVPVFNCNPPLELGQTSISISMPRETCSSPIRGVPGLDLTCLTAPGRSTSMRATASCAR